MLKARTPRAAQKTFKQRDQVTRSVAKPLKFGIATALLAVTAGSAAAELNSNYGTGPARTGCPVERLSFNRELYDAGEWSCSDNWAWVRAQEHVVLLGTSTPTIDTDYKIQYFNETEWSDWYSDTNPIDVTTGGPPSFHYAGYKGYISAIAGKRLGEGGHGWAMRPCVRKTTATTELDRVYVTMDVAGRNFGGAACFSGENRGVREEVLPAFPSTASFCENGIAGEGCMTDLRVNNPVGRVGCNEQQDDGYMYCKTSVGAAKHDFCCNWTGPNGYQCGDSNFSSADDAPAQTCGVAWHELKQDVRQHWDWWTWNNPTVPFYSKTANMIDIAQSGQYLKEFGALLGYWSARNGWVDQGTVARVYRWQKHYQGSTPDSKQGIALQNGFDFLGELRGKPSDRCTNRTGHYSKEYCAHRAYRGVEVQAEDGANGWCENGASDEFQCEQIQTSRGKVIGGWDPMWGRSCKMTCR